MKVMQSKQLRDAVSLNHHGADWNRNGGNLYAHPLYVLQEVEPCRWGI